MSTWLGSWTGSRRLVEDSRFGSSTGSRKLVEDSRTGKAGLGSWMGSRRLVEENRFVKIGSSLMEGREYLDDWLKGNVIVDKRRVEVSDLEKEFMRSRKE